MKLCVYTRFVIGLRRTQNNTHNTENLFTCITLSHSLWSRTQQREHNIWVEQWVSRDHINIQMFERMEKKEPWSAKERQLATTANRNKSTHSTRKNYNGSTVKFKYQMRNYIYSQRNEMKRIRITTTYRRESLSLSLAWSSRAHTSSFGELERGVSRVQFICMHGLMYRNSSTSSINIIWSVFVYHMK